MTCWTCCLSTALLAWAALLGARPAEPLPLSPARADLAFAPDKSEVRLSELVSELARVTGQEIVMESHLAQAFRSVRVTLPSPDPIAAGEAYVFVEHHLAAQGVWLAPVTGGTRPVLGMSPWIRDDFLQPVAISVAQLDLAAQHEALPVRVLVPLRNVDPNVLCKELRPSRDEGKEGEWVLVVPAGRHALLLQGRATTVVALARRALETDQAAARGEPESQTPEGGR